MPCYSTQHYSTVQYITLITPHHNCNCNCTTLITLHYNYNLQLRLHYATTTTSTPTTTTTTALRNTTSSSCGEVTTATIATHSRKHNSNHLSVHQWVRSAIRDSQRPTAPIRLVRYYWYQVILHIHAYSSICNPRVLKITSPSFCFASSFCSESAKTALSNGRDLSMQIRCHAVPWVPTAFCLTFLEPIRSIWIILNLMPKQFCSADHGNLKWAEL